MKNWVLELLSAIMIAFCFVLMELRINRLENELYKTGDRIVKSDSLILKLIDKEIESRWRIDNLIISKLPVMHIGDAKLDSVTTRNGGLCGYIISKGYRK